ncbi:unnamed protein product [Cylicocyclus nassatus]|uniref:Secreted protein n=1 Tax=Cylicocyclus nassatus TaxID=53992 RepID=A0AA36HAW6_CYLNA|nr:unnamed protein product [Cylicocyclus nassatus]
MRIFNYILLLPTILVVFCAVNVAASVLSPEEAREGIRRWLARFRSRSLKPAPKPIHVVGQPGIQQKLKPLGH